MMTDKSKNNMMDDQIAKLKEMRFSGMAEKLREQYENPNSDLRPFDERLSELIDAEWNLRYDKKFMRFLKRAHLKYPGAALDESIYDSSRGLDVATIEALSTCRWIREGKNLLITGLTGAGKSYIGCALAVCALKKFMSVRYIKSSMLMREIAAFRAQDDPAGILKYLNEMTKVDLLILDDFGLMSLDIDHCRDLFEVTDSRSPTRSTMVISQLPVKNWYDLFENRTYADSCLDRLLGNAYRLDFQGDSLRGRTSSNVSTK